MGIIIYIMNNTGDYVDMNNDKQLIKDRYVLKHIEQSISNITGISILNVHNNTNICKNYVEELDKIYKIEFPILISKKRGYKNLQYVEFLYKYLKLPINSYNWLIPNFDSSNWWVELGIDNLDNFMHFYYPDNKSINLTVIDTKNRLLFDIENGECDYEYRIIWL